MRIVNKQNIPIDINLGRLRVPAMGFVEWPFSPLDLQALLASWDVTLEETPVVPEATEPATTPPSTEKPAEQGNDAPEPPKAPKAPEPKVEALPEDRVAELRELAKGDKRSPTTRKAIELLTAAGHTVE
jgi:hypothetical protein